jgi:protein-L-isoaspartate O-methyltransferase
MKPTSFVTLIAAGIGLVSLGRAAAPVAFAQSAPSTKGDVIYVPTPPAVVDAMLQVAAVTERDIVYDLGSGDGRIVITAAKQYGARGVGIEIDPALVTKATENAAAAGVSDRVRFVSQDLFASDISEATVVTLYLLQSINERLRPKLVRELKPHACRIPRLQYGARMAAGEDAHDRAKPHLFLDSS